MPEYNGLPIQGYRKQSQEAVDAVNEFKRLEEEFLRAVDRLKANPNIAEDGRWLAIGVTEVEKGFMAVNRSIFKPQRIQGELTK